MSGGALPSVLFVTSELIGLFKNGGIGTATTGLIETVAGMGCPTTVLYTGAIWHLEVDRKPWIEHYGAIGVELIILSLADMRGLAGPVRDQGLGSAYLVYEFAKRRQFDIIHLNDALGEGMHVLAAKRLGTGFTDTLTVLGLHGPTSWAIRLNRQQEVAFMQAAFDAMERVSVRSADLLWGPSDYLLNEMRSTGWRLPGRVECRQLVMPTAELFRPDAAKFERADTPPPRHQVQRIGEIVFFGRLEQRKGLQLFCEALDRLHDRLVVRGISVTFLGKAVWQDGERTDDWLRDRAQSWRFPWRLETNLGQPEAVSYLRRSTVIAVMPSPIDNSPCTIYEAIQNGIPFLASATGGIPELIDPEDRSCTLFDYTVEGIETALVHALDAGVATARPRISQAANRNRWRKLHHDWRGYLPIAPGSGPAVRIVALVQHAEMAATRRTLRSVRQVLGVRLAGVILLADSPVSDGFPGAEIISGGGLSGAAIARAIEMTAASWVLCVLGGVELQADALPLVEKALSHPEIGAGLIPAARFKGRVVPPMGSAPAFGEFEGFLYTGGGLLAVAPALDALRPVRDTTTAPFAGLIGRIVAAGGELWPFPEPFLALDRLPMPSVQRAGLFDHSQLAEVGMIRAVQCTADGRPKLSRPRQLLLRFADSAAFPLAHPLAVRLAQFNARSPRFAWFARRALWFTKRTLRLAKRTLRLAKRALRFAWSTLPYFGDHCHKL